MKYLALFLIRAYQKTLSPDHGILKNYLTFYKCRFYPTCSGYCYYAIKKYGFLKGLIFGLNRIKRCHPWNEGGYDPLK
ncbi:MAG: membrane protein insertion efficiency factor YidD [Patescibacteria group bacterium]|mgnify:CR=1 FL=1